jgi:FixJ family two-component response regulator
VTGVTGVTGVTEGSLVSVVDDDDAVREALSDVLREFGFVVEVFASAEAFLASDIMGRTDCLVLDIAMPGMTGLELQRELKRRGLRIPIVFITAHADRTLRPRVLAAGAAECLFKPFTETALLEAVRATLSTP